MRIAFLTNSILASESIAFLHSTQMLKAVGILGRNRILRSHLESFASQNNIDLALFHKEHLEQDLNTLLHNAGIDLAIVQTFPYKIPVSSLKIPHNGFYNLHPGPLPQFRGPDPVFWVLKNKETHGAMTLHKMDADFDTGPVVLCEPLPIHPADTYGILNSHLAHAAPELLNTFLQSIINSTPIPPTQQPIENIGYQQKPNAQTLMVDWTCHTSEDIDALTRASNPNQNGCIAFFRDVITRFLEIDILTPEFDANLTPGTVITADEKRGLQVKCVDKFVIRLNIVHADEGYFSGKRFAEVFNVKIGEKFTPPSFLS